jgi:uncharacterized membrane protein YqjE
MTSPDALTDLLDTYMDMLGLVSIMVVVVWWVWKAFRPAKESPRRTGLQFAGFMVRHCGG